MRWVGEVRPDSPVTFDWIAFTQSLQIEVKRPLIHGFFLSTGYTWTKNITDGNNDFGGNTPFVPIVGHRWEL